MTIRPYTPGGIVGCQETGLSLGLLGGGGSILTVPILAYVAGLHAKEAIAASLFVVGVTSAVGVVTHARHGRVRWRTGLIFGAAGMGGAFVGGLIGGHIPGAILMIAFALMMLATAVAMIRGRRVQDAAPAVRELPVRRAVIDGLVVGLVTGMVGAGGGFLVVPALVLLGGLPMSVAVGTSLLVIAMKSFAGLAGYLTSVSLDWSLVLGVTAAAVAGSFIGASLSGIVPEQALRRGFGLFLLVMAAVVLGQELPVPLWPEQPWSASSSSVRRAGSMCPAAPCGGVLRASPDRLGLPGPLPRSALHRWGAPRQLRPKRRLRKDLPASAGSPTCPTHRCPAGTLAMPWSTCWPQPVDTPGGMLIDPVQVALAASPSRSRKDHLR